MSAKRGRNALLTLAGLGLAALVLYFVDASGSVKLEQAVALFAGCCWVLWRTF